MPKIAADFETSLLFRNGVMRANDAKRALPIRRTAKA